MKLSHLFEVSPFLALSFCVCLATLVWCAILIRRGCHHKADRYLIGFVGLLSMYQCAQVLRRGGILVSPYLHKVDEAVDLTVNSLYLIAVLLLRISNHDRFESIFRLRLVEAQPVAKVYDGRWEGEPSDPQFLQSIRSAVDILSANSLKLYLYICFHAGKTTGFHDMTEAELMQALSCSGKALQVGFKELRDKGLCCIDRLERTSNAVRTKCGQGPGKLDLAKPKPGGSVS